MKKHHASAHGISLKKYHGQHFLRDQSVVDHMLKEAALPDQARIVEVGPGDGFLTHSILEKRVSQLIAYEIDAEWANYIRNTYQDTCLVVHTTNFLDVDLAFLEPEAPWVFLSNLPYHVTWPILRKILAYRHVFSHAVVMMQEEVAQKLVASSGRGYGYPSLYFQHFFECSLLNKVPPTAFKPPPKVFSRIVMLKPRTVVQDIPQEEEFWSFIKLCFHQPRRTLKNNLQQSHYPIDLLSPDLLALRAQQMSMVDLLAIWRVLFSKDRSSGSR